jgi:hypothetical protein
VGAPDRHALIASAQESRPGLYQTLNSKRCEELIAFDFGKRARPEPFSWFPIRVALLLLSKSAPSGSKL